jgi:hypothetical protein
VAALNTEPEVMPDMTFIKAGRFDGEATKFGMVRIKFYLSAVLMNVFSAMIGNQSQSCD